MVNSVIAEKYSKSFGKYNNIQQRQIILPLTKWVSLIFLSVISNILISDSQYIFYYQLISV